MNFNVVCCLLFVICCLLFVVCYLPTTNNQQPTTNNQQPTTKLMKISFASSGDRFALAFFNRSFKVT